MINFGVIRVTHFMATPPKHEIIMIILTKSVGVTLTFFDIIKNYHDNFLMRWKKFLV